MGPARAPNACPECMPQERACMRANMMCSNFLHDRDQLSSLLASIQLGSQLWRIAHTDAEQQYLIKVGRFRPTCLPMSTGFASNLDWYRPKCWPTLAEVGRPNRFDQTLPHCDRTRSRVGLFLVDVGWILQGPLPAPLCCPLARSWSSGVAGHHAGRGVAGEKALPARRPW